MLLEDDEEKGDVREKETFFFTFLKFYLSLLAKFYINPPYLSETHTFCLTESLSCHISSISDSKILALIELRCHTETS